MNHVTADFGVNEIEGASAKHCQALKLTSQRNPETPPGHACQRQPGHPELNPLPPRPRPTNPRRGDNRGRTHPPRARAGLLLLPYTGRTCNFALSCPARINPFSFAAPPSHCTHALLCQPVLCIALRFLRVPRCPCPHATGPSANLRLAPLVLLWTGEWFVLGSGSPAAVGWCRPAFRPWVCPCCCYACFHGGAANAHCSGRLIR